MLLGGSEPARIYVGGTTVGVWSRTTTDDGPQWLPVESAQQGWSQALELLGRLAPRKRRRPVELWLSGALARPFIFQPVKNLNRWPDAIRIAAEMAPEVTGLQGPCEAWMDEWSPIQPSVAIAIDRDLREGLEKLAKERNFQLVALRPWWTRALNDALSQKPATTMLVAEEPDAVTVLCGTGGQFDFAASYVPKPDAQQLGAVLTRLSLAVNTLPSQSCRAVLVAGDGESQMAEAKVDAFPFAPRLDGLK